MEDSKFKNLDKIAQIVEIHDFGYIFLIPTLISLKPNKNGDLYLVSTMSIVKKSYFELYNLNVENYEAKSHVCWIIESITHYPVHKLFYIIIISKVFEMKNLEYPTLVPTSSEPTKLHSLHYKER